MTKAREAHAGRRPRRPSPRLGWLCGSLLAAGCAQAPPPLPAVHDVDLDRFMGRWYVIANIPTFLERDAYNAVESYERNGDGTIATTFTFRRGAFDGETVEYRPRGYVSDASPAVWGMQFVWPIKAEYRIAYIAPDYSRTIVARSARDYVWIMAREPEISPEVYASLVMTVGELGYDAAKLKRVPQRW
jgi:apolipoprotein D and lipocalin family protein